MNAYICRDALIASPFYRHLHFMEALGYGLNVNFVLSAIVFISQNNLLTGWASHVTSRLH